jgi:hypothetical protein
MKIMYNNLLQLNAPKGSPWDKTYSGFGQYLWLFKINYKIHRARGFVLRQVSNQPYIYKNREHDEKKWSNSIKKLF